jgi:SAM-dependent methyltransferase
MSAIKSIHRFSSRVDTYVRFRPSYPKQIVETLERECGFTADSIVADIASGTGIFTKLLLEHGNRVFGVEPNTEMRRAGEEFLASHPNFASVTGTAEATTLDSRSVDFVTAAQAGHWFDRQKSRQEFARILKSGGWAVLVWNERKTDSTPFLRDYEDLLLRFGTDYNEVRHEHTVVGEFFDPMPFQERTFDLRQVFDYAGVEGRLMSSSYAPPPAHPNHAPMLRKLHEIVDRHQQGGKVSIEYTTRMFYGQLA